MVRVAMRGHERQQVCELLSTLVTRYGFRVPDVIETMVQLAIAQRVEVRMLEGRDGDSPNRCQLPFWSLARAR